MKDRAQFREKRRNLGSRANMSPGDSSTPQRQVSYVVVPDSPVDNELTWKTRYRSLI